jgi:hypothetical protein
MKKVGIIILLTVLMMNGSWLKASAESLSGENRQASRDKAAAAKINTGNEQATFENSDSVINVRDGNNRLSVLESLEGPEYYSKKFAWNDHWDQKDSDNDHERRRRRFRGHWAGIELGFNNWVTSGNSMSLPADIDYMTLKTNKSSNFNINFTQLSLGLTRHFGFVTGLGLNWNNYRFDGNNNIVMGPDGAIQELDPGANLEKSKLATLFLTVPVLLEVQIPVEHNNLSIAGGPIGAIKLGSHTKMVFEDGHTVKSYRDFNLNMLRYGATARVGYGNFQLYGTYYMTPLFQKGKGPGGFDLYPFEIGIALSFNN